MISATGSKASASILGVILLLSCDFGFVQASSGTFCCSQNFKDCVTWCGTTQNSCESCQQDVFWIEQPSSSCKPRWQPCLGSEGSCCPGLTCVGDQYHKQCEHVPSAPTPPVETTSPSKSAPTPPVPTKAPTTSAPTKTPVDEPTYSCSNGSGKSTWDALLALDAITYQVSNSPYILSAVASGGAAGNGSYVVSESQAYAVLSAGLTILSLEEGDTNYDEAKHRFEGYFNGWRKMCRNSAPAPCQNPSYCDNGSSPCLPGWKHLADFSAVEGTGAAPDGDEDAIIGMIIALKAIESDSTKPSWYDEVQEWADRSCTQFLQDNTVLSSSGSHRLLKLGSCWGGWDGEGNNPSYHAPGHYRMMRDFQASIKNRSYSLPSFVTSESWNNLINTSYKFFETTQCADTGLVPNWALVQEVGQTLAKKSGSFSGSGTPQYEFGAEASRTMWRVAFDAAAYPEESSSQSGSFLAPLHTKLVDNFSSSPPSFGQNSLQACSPIVSNVFNNWLWNYFISAPVFSTLVSKIKSSDFNNKNFDQQTMVNAACERVSVTAGQSYYPLSWQVIAQMTLNGEVAKAGTLFHKPPEPTNSPIQSPTEPITPEPTAAPIKNPTTPEGCYSNNYKDCNPDDHQYDDHSCNTIWLPTGARDSCIALWGECTGQTNDCCEPAICSGDSNYSACVPQPSCIVCDDKPTNSMKKNGKDCATSSSALDNNCNKNNKWMKKNFCQLSCFNAGNGYDGDVCCT